MSKFSVKNYIPFLQWRNEINKSSLKADLLAGLTGSIIVLPQGVAFAMIAGLPPVYGLYTAIVLPIIAALFGSSKHLVSGPTTAISLIVFASISEYATPGSNEYIQLAILLTFLSGAIQLVMGVVQLGTLVNFVSHTVIHGFTAGAALLIIFNQLPNMFGLPKNNSSNLTENLIHFVEHLPNTNTASLTIALTTLVVAWGIRKIKKGLPNMLIAMLIGSIMAFFFTKYGYSVKLVGELPSHLPPFSAIHFDYALVRRLLPDAFAVALLGLISTVAIARSIGAKSGQLIDPNQEFIGQGLANLTGSFFSSYAGSGSFTRSGVNYESGAKTQLSSVFSSLFLVIILLFIGPLAAYLPISSMGGIILLIGFNLIDMRSVKLIMKSSKREMTVLVITFLSTLLLDLEYAILLGVMFSLIFYLQRTSRPRIISLIPDPVDTKRKFLNARKYRIDQCPQFKIVRIEGSLFFGAVDHAERMLANYRVGKETHLLIVGNGINLIDTSGAEMLVRVAEDWRKKGGQMYISGLKKRARESLYRGEFKKIIGKDSFFDNKEHAVAEIYTQLNKDICKNCSIKAFLECKTQEIENQIA